MVGRIIPFNHPLMFAAAKIAAPLVAGNPVVLKPSEHTSLSALRLAGLARGLFVRPAVFTRDLRLAHTFARDVEAGYASVNDVARHWPATSFGGVKDSGLGREADLEELDSCTQAKNVNVNLD